MTSRCQGSRTVARRSNARTGGLYIDSTVSKNNTYAPSGQSSPQSFQNYPGIFYLGNGEPVITNSTVQEGRRPWRTPAANPQPGSCLCPFRPVDGPRGQEAWWASRSSSARVPPEHVDISTMTTKVVIVEIVDRARKHGVADVDILHAFTNAIRVHALDGYLMLVGPATDGQLLELGYNAARDRIFHAMSARPKYL